MSSESPEVCVTDRNATEEHTPLLKVYTSPRFPAQQLFALDTIFDAEYKLVTKVLLDREQQAEHEVNHRHTAAAETIRLNNG